MPLLFLFPGRPALRASTANDSLRRRERSTGIGTQDCQLRIVDAAEGTARATVLGDEVYGDGVGYLFLSAYSFQYEKLDA